MNAFSDVALRMLLHVDVESTVVFIGDLNIRSFDAVRKIRFRRFQFLAFLVLKYQIALGIYTADGTLIQKHGVLIVTAVENNHVRVSKELDGLHFDIVQIQREVLTVQNRNDLIIGPVFGQVQRQHVLDRPHAVVLDEHTFRTILGLEIRKKLLRNFALIFHDDHFGVGLFQELFLILLFTLLAENEKGAGTVVKIILRKSVFQKIGLSAV